MIEGSILQQLYVKQGQFIVNNQIENVIHKPPTYFMYLILPIFIGMLISGIPLAVVLTLHIRQPSRTSVSTTVVSTTITSSTTTTTTQTTQMNQTNSSIAVNPCSGFSSYTLWQLFPSEGIMIDIDTSSCNFNSTPNYFTSITGIGFHFLLGGYTAIYSSTKNSFRVYARSLVGWNSTVLLSFSQTNQWNIDWFAVSN